MWLFWIVAGVLAAAAVALIVFRAAGAARAVAAGAEDPVLAVYRRQLAEIDDLADRGLLADGERRAAHAEAGRRLLKAADRPGAAEGGGAGRARGLLMGGVGVAMLAALGLYLALGSPGFPDQPFKARLAQWRANPERLHPAEMAAVLKELTRQRPNDPEAWEFLGRADLAAGDAAAAADALRKAVALAPGKAALHVMLAEALMTGDGGKASPAALAALGKAVEIDPKNLSARYFLARAQITSGDRAAGKAAWEALRAEIPADDPRRKVLDEDIAGLLGEGAPASGAVAVAETAEQAQFIRGMVARLAARLETSPDDPEGWARLVRAYRVLGDREAEAKAVDRARKLFAGRPQDLARIEAEAAP